MQTTARRSGSRSFLLLFKTTTMAEPMALQDKAFAHALPDLPIQQPRQCIEIHGREDHLVVSGEFVMLREPVAHKMKFHGGNERLLHSSVCRLLRIEHSRTAPPRALVNLFFFPVGLPYFPVALPAVPPRNRTYILYPNEVFWSNFLMWIPQEQVNSEAFVFLEEEIVNGAAGFCPGMENAFLVRAQWHQEQAGEAGTWTRLVEPSQFQSFPSKDCYSKRAWEFVLKLARLIFYELSRSSIIQRTQRSDYLDCHSGDWEYLRYRLQPEVEVVDKFGVSTVTYSRKNGTKEVIKTRLSKYLIRVDTVSLFEKLQSVLGDSIMTGLRLPAPAAPKMRARENTSFASCRASTEDSFNMFYGLPEVSLDRRTHRPIHRGVDLLFDSLKRKLRVCIRFRRAYPGDPSITQYLDLLDPPPAVPPGDPDGGSESETAADDEPQLYITEGLIIGAGQAVLKVRRITAGGTHVICFVVESADKNYLEGSERVLTMPAALQLYVDYINN
jgi:hypothetical protein